ncbi:MAG: PsbP-related protein [Methanothrix sp.]|nr:PsbP-related protein [Methanothrix sp.]
MKRNHFLGLMVLLTFAFFIPGCYAQNGSVTTSLEGPVGTNDSQSESLNTSGAVSLSDLKDMQLYENAEYGFSISYPSDWIAQEPDPNELGIVAGFLAPGEDIDNPQNYVTLQIEELPVKQDITLDQYSNYVLKNLKGSYSDFKSLAEGDMLLSEQPAHVLAYSATVDQMPYQVLLAYTLKEKKAYIATYYALADSYAQYEDDAKEIINSFQFL